MKHTPETIVKKLNAYTSPGLTARELADLQANLQAYAAFHPAPETKVEPITKAVSPHSAYRAWIGAFALITLVVSTGSFATVALPGENLYGVKVHIIEPAIGFGQVGDVKKLQYQASLVEERLFEMRELAAVNKLGESEFLMLEVKILEHGTDIVGLIEEDGDASISEEMVLDTLSDVVSVVRTQEIVSDQVRGNVDDSIIAQVEESVVDQYRKEAGLFAEADPARATLYLETELVALQSTLDDLPAEESTEEVQDYLADVTGALEGGSLEAALVFLNDAHSVVTVQANLDMYADEPVETLE